MRNYTRKHPPMSPLTEDQRQLAESPAVHALARRILYRVTRKARPTLLDDEIESALGWAILRAAATYDPSRGASFYKHACRRMNGAVQDALRDWHGGRCHDRLKAHSLDDALRHGSEETHAEMLTADILPVGWEIEREDECRAVACRTSLSVARYVRIALTRADSVKLADAGRRLSVGQSRVSQLRKLAVQELREQHESGELDLSNLIEIGGAA